MRTRILATGNLNKNTKGFTLIEILVVVVLVSILTVMGVQMLTSGSVERNLKQHGKILQSSINYACDQATLQNIPYGVKFYNTGYQFSQFVNQQWLDIITENSTNKDLEDGSFLTLEIDGLQVILDKQSGETPQLMCDTSGQLTSFVLTITDATKSHHYQIKTIDFWQIQGQWLDAEQI